MPLTQDEIDARLKEADAANNVVTLGQTMVGLMNIQPSLTFCDFEMRFREMGSNTYLVAIPTQFIPFGFVSYHPTDHSEAKFYLWICLEDGQAERDGLLREYGMTAEDNLKALTSCGVMVIGDVKRQAH